MINIKTKNYYLNIRYKDIWQNINNHFYYNIRFIISAFKILIYQKTKIIINDLLIDNNKFVIF